MKLDKLQLFGFKSFAEKTDFKFRNGVTAIVGPNGSGKSNIVDAFRWILGEQSAKSLRGSDMKDVIFNGTTKRKPLGFAEASLAFTDAEDVLGEGDGKLVLTRRLYRSGESEYLINGKVSRLKDIKDMLAGTGVGFNAYSILEQDKIDKLLSVNADERRLVFEEAAGISGYRARRKKTERELEKTEQYLLRLGDIISELRSRERSVKIQAGRARRYRELTEKLGRIRLDLYMLKFRGHSERMREIDSEIDVLKHDAAELEGSVRLLESQLARRESSMHSLDTHLRELRTQQAQAQNRAVAAEEKTTYNRQRIDELAVRMKSIAGDIKSAEEKIENAISERAGIKGRLDKLAAQEAAVENELKEHRQKIYEASVNQQELEKSQEDLRSEGAGALEERSAVRNKLATLAEDSKKFNANHGSLKARCEKISKDTEEIAASIGELEKELESLKANRAGLIQELEAAQKKLRDAETEKVRLHQRRDSLSIDRAKCQSRLDTLQALIARHAGIGNGVQYIIARKGEAGFEGVRGLLGELVDVDIENAPVVEAALGRLAEAVVVDTPETAARLAENLKETDVGSALFVPLAWGEMREDAAGSHKITSLLKCKPDIEKMLCRLAGNVRVAGTLKDALEGALKDLSATYVTKEGELAGKGLLSGGSRNSGGIIQRKSEVTALEKELENINSQLSGVEKKLSDCESSRRALSEKCNTLVSNIDAISGDISRVEARRNELMRDRSYAETELRTLETEIADLESLIEYTEKTRSELSARLETVEKECRERQTALEETRTQLMQARDLRESLMEGLTAIQVRLAKERQECESLSREFDAKEREIDERRQVRKNLEEETQRIDEADKAARSDVEEAARQLDELVEETSRLQAKISESEQKYSELEEEVNGARRERDEAASQLREFEGRISEMRIERQACTTQIESVTDYAREEIGIEINESELRDMILPDADPKELEKEVRETREKVGRLGNVNMEALDELEEITARLTFYTDQEQDLVESKGKLLDVMAKIDKKCRSMLERSFKEIRKNFQSIFRKLFNGGRADIFFEEGRDILEAGIIVVAKPPGKDPKNLNLLSGGEKAMTTIALLFAIFRSKLSPFCILDEIDAPLDESNVNRFQQLLREFISDCRFLIITHNKVSMSAADTLYGITMQEPGVTRRISITFEEAAKQAEEPQIEEKAHTVQEPAAEAVEAAAEPELAGATA